MRRNCFLFSMVCLSVLCLLTACTQKFPGYKKTADGLYYKFHSQNPTAAKPQLTDFLKVNMACYLHDSLYYDWQGSQKNVFTQLQEPIFVGDLQEAYAMMHLGDSASFYIKADSVVMKYYDQDPKIAGLKTDDYFRFEVGLVEVQSENDFKSNIEKMMESMKEASKKALEDYVVANNINVKPEPSGVYIIPMEKGNGRCPVKGDQVEVDFAAYLLDGQSVGSTWDSPEKLSFVLGEGLTIQGWEEIVPKMHLGERVKAIIPFDLAYGEHSVGSIPSYANLIYDIKLLKITTAEELKKQTEAANKALQADSEKAFSAYLKANGITEHTASGLYYTKSLVTDGAQPQMGQTARIKFKAAFLNGTPLGDSDQLGGFYDAVLGQGKVLKGLEEGLCMMHVGEQARFVLPYPLAYGDLAFENIPAFANIVFDVELLDVLDETNQQ